MFLDLTSVGTPGHRRDRGCASRHADSIVPKRDGCTSISQSEVGGELAAPKLQSFVQKSLMGPPMASLRQYTGLSSARLRSSRICSCCNRIWSQNFWVYWEMFSGYNALTSVKIFTSQFAGRPWWISRWWPLTASSRCISRALNIDWNLLLGTRCSGFSLRGGLATQTATVSASSVPLPVPAGSSQNYVPDDHYFHPPRAKASCVSTYL